MQQQKDHALDLFGRRLDSVELVALDIVQVHGRKVQKSFRFHEHVSIHRHLKKVLVLDFLDALDLVDAFAAHNVNRPAQLRAKQGRRELEFDGIFKLVWAANHVGDPLCARVHERAVDPVVSLDLAHLEHVPIDERAVDGRYAQELLDGRDGRREASLCEYFEKMVVHHVEGWVLGDIADELDHVGTLDADLCHDIDDLFKPSDDGDARNVGQLLVLAAHERIVDEWSPGANFDEVDKSKTLDHGRRGHKAEQIGHRKPDVCVAWCVHSRS